MKTLRVFNRALEGSNGNTVVIEDGAGGGTDIVNLTWTFDDTAATTLPNGDPLVSGTFRPGQNEYNDIFAPPADPPASWFTSFAAAFNGSNGNGNWNLYVQDFVGGDSGSIGSWSITLVPEPATIAVLALGALGLIRRRR